MATWFEEIDAHGFMVKLAVERIVCQRRTEFQELTMFDSPRFGRTLALAVPVSAGGYMVLAGRAAIRNLHRVSREVFDGRSSAANLATRFHTVDFHRACFARPRPIAALLE